MFNVFKFVFVGIGVWLSVVCCGECLVFEVVDVGFGVV